MTLRPIKGFVLLLDDQPERVEEGVLVRRDLGNAYMDYVVAAGGGDGFGTGDRVVVSDPNVGRKVKIDGVVYRLVKAEDVLAVM